MCLKGKMDEPNVNLGKKRYPKTGKIIRNEIIKKSPIVVLTNQRGLCII